MKHKARPKTTWRQAVKETFEHTKKFIAEHKQLVVLGTAGAIAITTFSLLSPWAAIPLTGGGALLSAAIQSNVRNSDRGRFDFWEAVFEIGVGAFCIPFFLFASSGFFAIAGPGRGCPVCVAKKALNNKQFALNDAYIIRFEGKHFTYVVEGINDREVTLTTKYPSQSFWTGKKYTDKQTIHIARKKEKAPAP